MNFKIDFSKIKNYVIAEIGTNHNRSKEKAIKMIKEISKTNCNCVKFQIYEAREIVSKKVMASSYGLDSIYGNITAYEMFDKYLVTPKSWFPELKALCHKKKLAFAVTIHGENGINWAKKNKPDFIKIASMDHNNFPFIKKIINKLKVPIVVSLGMAKYKDIVILIKLLKSHNYGFALFHCTSLYPPKINESRLPNISYLINKFKVPIGFSDHFIGVEAAKKAKLYGANFFEKHVTLNNQDLGPDHKFALPIKELNNYVVSLQRLNNHKKIKYIPKLFKTLSKRELSIRKKYTKSIIAKFKIKKNSKITKKNIYLSRPGTGIAPKFYEKLNNKIVKKSLHPEQVLKWKHIKK